MTYLAQTTCDDDMCLTCLTGSAEMCEVCPSFSYVDDFDECGGKTFFLNKTPLT
jgi:hypothetical protein